jgi:hypothetical protein
MGLIHPALPKEPGLPYPGFAGHQHDLPMSRRGPAPGVQQASQLGLTANKWRLSVLPWRYRESPGESRQGRLRPVVEDRTGPCDTTLFGNRDRAQQRLAPAKEREVGFSKIRGTEETIDIKRAEYPPTTFVSQFPQPSQNIHWPHLFQRCRRCLPKAIR